MIGNIKLLCITSNITIENLYIYKLKDSSFEYIKFGYNQKIHIIVNYYLKQVKHNVIW